MPGAFLIAMFAGIWFTWRRAAAAYKARINLH